jgi:hypothetical protein
MALAEAMRTGRMVLKHAADPAAMLMLSDNDGNTALNGTCWLRGRGKWTRCACCSTTVCRRCSDDGAHKLRWRERLHADCLDAMLLEAALHGCVDVMRLLFDRPSADPAAMLVHCDGDT